MPPVLDTFVPDVEAIAEWLIMRLLIPPIVIFVCAAGFESLCGVEAKELLEWA